MKPSIFKKGFTLIELLVVIAVIGILATIILSQFNSVQKRARDGKFFAEMKQSQISANNCRLGVDSSDVQGKIESPADNGNVCKDVNIEDAKYPTKPTGGGWKYISATNTGSTDFSFGAYVGENEDSATKKMTCTQAGCKKTGF